MSERSVRKTRHYFSNPLFARRSLSPNKMASTTESGEVDNNSLRTLSADIRAMASLNREISSGSGSGLSTDSFREQSER